MSDPADSITIECAEVQRDSIRVRAVEDGLSIDVSEPPDVAGVHLDEARVRRLRDWLTAWLGDGDE